MISSPVETAIENGKSPIEAQKSATAMLSEAQLTGIPKSPGYQLILETPDGVQHFIARSDATHFDTVTRMLHDLRLENLECPTLKVPVCFKTQTLITLIDLSREWAKIDEMEKKTAMKISEEWDKKLKAIPKPLLFDIADAANFLAANPIYEASVQRIADDIKSMNVEEMGVYFGVKNDLSQAEMRKIHNEFDVFMA